MIGSKVFGSFLALMLGAIALGAGAGPVASPLQAETRETVWSEEPLVTGRSRFGFYGWSGPPLPIWAYVPSGIDRKTAPIMILMHGAGRGARRYLEEWVDHADERGFIIVSPEFARHDFPSSRFYNRGGLFDEAGAPLNPEEEWAFSAIEPLFDAVVAQIGGSQTSYTMYGHSAGSQFVHRFMFLKPDARVSRFLLANAGWYTFPDVEQDYPYGLRDVPVSDESIQSVLEKDVVLLLGDRDTDTEHSSLNRSAPAMRQGEHRFARGQNFYASARALAQQNGWAFNWSVRIIEGVAHSNGGIADGSFDLIE